MGHWKGGAGELEVIERLNRWWRQIEPGFTLCRTPGSGGWANSREVPPGFKGRGDLMSGQETRFSFSVEVKWRQEVKERSIANFTASRRSPVWAYWDQTVQNALKDDLRPMLWFRGANVLIGGRMRRMPWRVVTAARGGTALVIRLEEEFLALDPRIFLAPA